MTKNTPIKAIIWDLDHTLYFFSADLGEACHDAAVKMVDKMGLPLDPEEARMLAEQSYDQYGNSWEIFVHEYNVPQEHAHADFHDLIDLREVKRCDKAIAAFKQTRGVRHGVLTHSSTGWAHRVLDKTGLASFFAKPHILGREKTNFHSKCGSRRPFEQLMYAFNLKPENILVVEDTAKNLRIPHDMGMQTALIHYGHPQAKQTHIHGQFSSVPAILRWVRHVNVSQNPGSPRP